MVSCICIQVKVDFYFRYYWGHCPVLRYFNYAKHSYSNSPNTNRIRAPKEVFNIFWQSDFIVRTFLIRVENCLHVMSLSFITYLSNEVFCETTKELCLILYQVCTINDCDIVADCKFEKSQCGLRRKLTSHPIRFAPLKFM